MQSIHSMTWLPENQYVVFSLVKPIASGNNRDDDELNCTNLPRIQKMRTRSSVYSVHVSISVDTEERTRYTRLMSDDEDDGTHFADTTHCIEARKFHEPPLFQNTPQ